MAKKIERNEQMRAMRMNGASLAEISEKFGVSRQRVQQVVGSQCYFRAVTPEACIYKGIRDWMNENRISRTYFVRMIYDDTHAVLHDKVSGILKGANCSKKMIDKILAVTGLPYEVAFKVEGEEE